MSTQVTFTDVERKYRYVAEHVEFCRNAALSDDFPPQAKDWLHPPTLARWLYGSVLEFCNELYLTANKFEDRTTRQGESINAWALEISKKVGETREEIDRKYPSILSRQEALSS